MRCMCDNIKKCDKVRALRSCSGVVHVARVHVIALVVDVVCFMLVLIARVVVHAVVVAFP